MKMSIKEMWEKAVKVVASCTTEEQFKVAEEFIRLAKQRQIEVEKYER